MSNNLGQFNSSKNGAAAPSWGRSNAVVPQNMPQMMNQSLSNMNSPGMLQFQQQHTQVFQSALSIQQGNLGALGLQQMANNAINAAASQLASSNQLFQQVGTVSYPNPRALNTAAFQSPQNLTQLTQQIQQSPGNGSNNNTGKQRVFTGTVTKVLDNFGFVDEDVFFQTNVCVKGSNPVVGDRVLVEASYNPSMPFKWNATRIQVLPTSSGHTPQSRKSYSSGYNAVPPPESPGNNNSGNFRGSRPKASLGGRGRERSRDREREEEEMERKRRREERQREREKEEKKSPVRRRSRSPKTRRRPRIVPRYMVQIPKIALNSSSTDVLVLRRRYGNMYIPSDFFYSNFEWVNAFPLNKPFSLSKPCCFHVMSKEVEPPVSDNDSVLEPPDSDYLFSAKVMLMNVPGMEELYSKCCAMAEDEDKRDGSEEKDYIHPSRLINFLVGLRGKNETMAIGGPWSASLDGMNPDKDPSVLIRTAIRTCRALTGINLSNCTQWYRFTELYYRRAESVHKGKNIPARVETVVIYLPDVWSCVPTRLEWDNLVQSYQKQLKRELKPDEQPPPEDERPADEKDENETVATVPSPGAGNVEPTHHAQLDLKTMNVNDLKKELKARNVPSKGLRSQLVARLSKLLKAEAERTQTEDSIEIDLPEVKPAIPQTTEAEEKKIDEKEKSILIKRYTLPDQQHILVHPSKTAKSGKFDCTVMSLSLLLDYRPEDTKEHSFEVSLFAELFNEMLMRDFGFNIYKMLYNLPDKPKEECKKRESLPKKKPEDEEKKEAQSDETSREKDETKSEKSIRSDSEDDSNEKDKKKDKDKKKTRVKLYTKYKQLLLSFIYFDQTHCGYIFDKDIEDLLYTLGLNLSRAQVKKLVGKVITRDSLHYRKLTDKPKDEEGTVESNEELSDETLKELAAGNRKLLPVFNSDENTPGDEKESGSMVMFQGALIDISKLLSQLERSDKARVETETRVVSLKNENGKLSEKYEKTNVSLKRINSELKEYKEKLKTVEETLSKTSANMKLYQNTLTEIRDRIDPILKGATVKDECKREKDVVDKDKKEKDESAKTRWEKDMKIENAESENNK